MPKKKARKEQLGGDALRQSLKGDDTFLKYRRILKSIKSSLDVEKTYEEIKALHQGRISRNLYGTTPGADKITNAVLQDVRCRSRLAELALGTSRYHDMLDIAIDETRKYLVSKYGDEAPELRTKAERQAYFDVYLSSGLALKAQLSSLLDNIDRLIKDIDQTSFSFKHIIDCLELVYSKNNDKTHV